MPWQVLKSPLAQWDALPSFLVGELLFYGLAIATLVHALRGERAHRLYWVGALVAGTANDLIFMALPLVDNFWHGQAVVMLSPRLPLYIPCVYVSFLYLPAVTARGLGLKPLGAAAVTGILAVLFYAPFDVVGAKLLWWTWHDTDLPVATRVFGAPASSTLWVLTFAGAFAGLLAVVERRATEPPSGRAFAIGLAVVALLTTVVMVVQITILQQLDGGAPSWAALGVGVGVYVVVAAVSLRRLGPKPRRADDRLLLGAVLVHYATLLAILALADPATHRSEGVHQEVGECGVEARDIAGLVRHRYLCATDFDEDFSFDCVDAPPEDGAEWYTICGRSDPERGARLAYVAFIALLGALAFALAWRRRKAPR